MSAYRASRSPGPVRPTIRDVARAAGVSTQTVSRVLNDRPDVAAETSERVLKVIGDLGYAPNVVARSLMEGRTHMLGVVAYGLEYFGPSRIVAGIERQAAAAGYGIALTLLHGPEPANLAKLIRDLAGGQADGVIWAVPEVGGNRSWSMVEKATSIPIVLVGGITHESALPRVGIDNRAIGRIATNCLLDGGARRIGLITGPLSWREAVERREGWLDAHRARGLEPRRDLVVEGDWSAPSGREGLLRLLQADPELDGVFAENDPMALGALRAAHLIGRAVPASLSIVGADNIDEASQFWPSLTTVDQPLIEAGERAVTMIDGLIHGGGPGSVGPLAAPHVVLEPHLIVRESSRQS